MGHGDRAEELWSEEWQDLIYILQKSLKIFGIGGQESGTKLVEDVPQGQIVAVGRMRAEWIEMGKKNKC